ncbi:hypothetical protein D4764_08G0004580 [Takifugu flavidus]|uniref:Uncharacterized protein n=1 Tax=Takifugu flavidus TaxID=433684 RepID=A0A5C6MQN6_9TELE|nr:hypothetical protein D4764_08G0004580 [Takifugu flavidus]
MEGWVERERRRERTAKKAAIPLDGYRGGKQRNYTRNNIITDVFGEEERRGEERRGEERRGEERRGQDRTGQDRTGQDRTGQDRTCSHDPAE